MAYDEHGNMTYRGCYYIPYVDLPTRTQVEIARTWSRETAQGYWKEKESWAFAVNKKNELIRCPYIEPCGQGDTLEHYRKRLRDAGRIK